MWEPDHVAHLKTKPPRVLKTYKDLLASKAAMKTAVAVEAPKKTKAAMKTAVAVEAPKKTKAAMKTAVAVEAPKTTKALRPQPLRKAMKRGGAMGAMKLQTAMKAMKAMKA